MIKIDPPDEWKAAGSGAWKAALIRQIPGLDVALAAYDELEARRREKSLEEFKAEVLARVEGLEATASVDWLGTDDGQIFAGKVLDAALDAQMADKRQLFANVLINGALSEELDFVEKAKFVDLLRSLSRVALDVLAELHNRFSAIMRKPPHERTESTYIERDRIAEELSSSIEVDPFLISAAVQELQSAGLFSAVTSWHPNRAGGMAPGRTYSGSTGGAYTDFTERFVRFITEPTSATAIASHSASK